MIYLASDHAGFELKKQLLAFLKENNYPCEDCGAFKMDQFDDYPDFIIPAAQKVASSSENLGIVIGGSGQGEAIAANKVKGIRAALFYGGNRDIITLSKEHNNANVLSLGARFVTVEEAKEVLKLWLDTKFSGEERHQRRINKLSSFENQQLSQ